MRIAIFSDNFYPELSGVADSITSLGRELGKRGHRVRYFVPRYGRRDYDVVHASREEPNLGENVSIVRFGSLHYPTPTKQGRMVIPIGFRTCAVRRFNPDVIHTQLFFGTGIEALIAAKILKKPLVGTNHTAVKEFLKYGPVHGDRVDRIATNYVNWYYGKCMLTTAPSRSVVDEMRDLGFRGETHVISNPIEITEFHPIRHKAHLKGKFGNADATVIHAGRLATERSIDVIIRAIAALKKDIPHIQLLIAGKGAAENDLELLAQKLGVGENVRFLGFLDKATLNEAYNMSGCFAITSTSDTQSMVMMQAMAAGLPIVGVKARALPEYITEHNGFIVEPGDHEALAQKILLILNQENLRRKLGHGARLTAEKFSAPEIAKEWEKIYAGVIDAYQ